MTGITSRLEGTMCRIRLSGNLSIYQTKDLKKRLLEILPEPASVYELDADDLASLDLPVFQVILAFRTSLLTAGKCLTLKPVLPVHPFAKTAADLGIVLDSRPQTHQVCERVHNLVFGDDDIVSGSQNAEVYERTLNMDLRERGEADGF